MSDTNLLIRLDIKTTREELVNYILECEEWESAFEPGESHTKESCRENLNKWTILELVKYVEPEFIDTIHAQLDYGLNLNNPNAPAHSKVTWLDRWLDKLAKV